MTPLRLHIGGKEPKAGWTILNAQPGDHVDIVGDCRDLSQFADGSVADIYISHTLEHLSYAGELVPTLKGFHRVMKPGARLLISVPNMDVLCRMITHEGTDTKMRYQLMRMLFGGQVDDWDYHKVGFTPDLLAAFLGEAEFETVEQVPFFGLFQDASELKIGNVPISLNVIAYR
ncbi:class I SAM-dependent methyltransferase [Aestuariispira insulae]|uniref:Putative SAM-dependent methyltransferase n=1 Tax=Aestuariispira insulae TaxID=1461337 RepID=A0A3D9HUF5_9PROT|nr:methyltransferase domain-containing protein [Aestuariispira insulae]RED52516.1 putative SAM-dependent methyltransferase [Aestuariispira insulae]